MNVSVLLLYIINYVCNHINIIYPSVLLLLFSYLGTLLFYVNSYVFYFYLYEFSQNIHIGLTFNNGNAFQ